MFLRCVTLATIVIACFGCLTAGRSHPRPWRRSPRVRIIGSKATTSSSPA